MVKIFISFLSLCSIIASFFNVYAATLNGDLSVSASVAASCNFPAANNLAFGVYDLNSALTTITGSMSLNCTKGTKITSIALDNGLHASGSQRKMAGVTSGNTDLLQYNIFKPTGAQFGTSPAPGSCTILGLAWGAGANALTFISPNDNFNATQTDTINVCGQIPVSQVVNADSYADTVTITVNF